MFADWRQAFFTADHPSSDEVPKNHNPHCPCSKLAKDWLIESGVALSEWVEMASDRAEMSQDEVKGLICGRLFAVTRRSLSTDFKQLVKQGFLEESERRYRRTF